MARGILFDLFNTLVPGGNTGRAATVRRMGAAVGVDPDLFARSFVESWRERMIGALGDLEAQCREFARRLGGDPTDEQIARAVTLRLEFNRRTMVVTDQALHVLARLRAAGFRLGIVSNCTIDSGTVLDETPLPAAVDAVVLSFAVAIAKPDPRIYRRALTSLGVDAAECAYVGDGADRELDGASSLGMHVYQTTQFADSHPGWAGPKVTDLAALPGILIKDQT